MQFGGGIAQKAVRNQKGKAKLQLTIVNINKRSYLQMCNVTKTLHILFFLLSFQAKMFIIKLVIYNALFCII